MGLIGPRAQELLAAALTRVEPHLPDGVRLLIMPHKKWTTLALGNPEFAYSRTVRSISSPAVLPKQRRAKIAAQEAVEMVLDVAYWKPSTPSKLSQLDFDVHSAISDEGVTVSYRPPGGTDDERIVLAPIPLNLL